MTPSQRSLVYALILILLLIFLTGNILIYFNISNTNKKTKLLVEQCWYNDQFKLNSFNITWDNHFYETVTKLSNNNSIIITGANYEYKDVVLNWIRHMQKIGITEYIILCYDIETLTIVGPWYSGGHGFPVFGCNTHIEYMLIKFVIVNMLINSNYIVTWSDSDCLWRHPFLNDYALPYYHNRTQSTDVENIYQKNSDIDLIAQMGTYPNHIYATTGATICMGLITVFPTMHSKQLFTYIRKYLAHYYPADDQYTINQILSNKNIMNFDKINMYHDNVNMSMWLQGNSSLHIRHNNHYVYPLIIPKYNTSQTNGVTSIDITSPMPHQRNQSSGHINGFKHINIAFYPYEKFPRGQFGRLENNNDKNNIDNRASSSSSSSSTIQLSDNDRNYITEWKLLVNLYNPCIWHMNTMKVGKDKVTTMKRLGVWIEES
jgi:hypothetical protein